MGPSFIPSVAIKTRRAQSQSVVCQHKKLDIATRRPTRHNAERGYSPTATIQHDGSDMQPPETRSATTANPVETRTTTTGTTTTVTQEAQEIKRATNKCKTDTILTDSDGEPLLHVVFVHPQIHWNTGNIGRTCLGLGARLHLIQPLGFSLSDKHVRRAGLDYWQHVDVHVHASWEAFSNGELVRLGGRRYFFSKFGTSCASELHWGAVDAHDHDNGDGDGGSDGGGRKIVLVFGSEVDGFDGIRDWLDGPGQSENVVAFPMVDDRFRSFNLSTTASMALWDAYKCVKRKQGVENDK